MNAKTCKTKSGHPYLTVNGERVENARFIQFDRSHDGKDMARFEIIGSTELVAEKIKEPITKKAKTKKKPVETVEKQENTNEDPGDLSKE